MLHWFKISFPGKESKTDFEILSEYVDEKALQIRGDLTHEHYGIKQIRAWVHELDGKITHEYRNVTMDERQELIDRLYKKFFEKCCSSIEFNLNRVFDIHISDAIIRVQNLYTDINTALYDIQELYDYPPYAQKFGEYNERARQKFCESYETMIDAIKEHASRNKLLKFFYFTESLNNFYAKTCGSGCQENVEYVRTLFLILHYIHDYENYPYIALDQIDSYVEGVTKLGCTSTTAQVITQPER